MPRWEPSIDSRAQPSGDAHRTFIDNVTGLSIEEALDAAGGYRSILGLMKHVAGWSAIYHSYAFEDQPRRWNETDLATGAPRSD